MKRHLKRSDYSEDSSSDCFEIRHNAQSLTKKHELDDDDISDTEAMMLGNRKQLKTTLLVPSSAATKRVWTSTEELNILRGIVDYQNETKLSYTSDWNAFYDSIRDSIDSDISRKQLSNKILKLKSRFGVYQTRSNDGKRLSFANDHDKQVFRLSMVIWGKTKTITITKSASNENFMDQTEEDVFCVEKEREIDDGEKEKCEDLNVLQEALVMAASFRSLGNYQRKSVLRNLKSIGAIQRKELTDEWKALLAEDMQLGIKKQSFCAKLVTAGFSA